MYKRYFSAQRRFIRVKEFLTTNPVEGTQVKLQLLDEIVRDLTEHGQEQDVNVRVTRGETARQRSLRRALWSHHMVPISRIARRAFGIPGLDQKFALPPKRADNEAILAAARGMVQAAEAHVEVFVEQEGLPASSFTAFRQAIDDLASALATRIESLRRKQLSNETLHKLVKRGVATIDVLDAIVAPRLESQPELLATWKLQKRPMDPPVFSGQAQLPDITPVVKAA
jgi:hypothetical protein